MNETPDVPRLHLIQLAGGQGTRATTPGQEIPKQFRNVDGRLLLQISLEAFLRVPADTADIVSVTVTVPDTWRQRAEHALESLAAGGMRAAWQLAAAGKTRTASTWSAVHTLQASLDAETAPRGADLVAVHDAARPFATTDLLARLVRAAAVSGAAVPGIPVPDTIVQADAPVADAECYGAHYLDRATLLAVQTPQVFRWDAFCAAHAWAAAAGLDFTDDGGLLARQGHDPVVVTGEEGNWKVTTAADWQRAVAVLST
jgi:2-C-methyl-D-erythritol 4-phosphate cytidylyltransferase/2-C-methyl-D-erythritol 2,4-cyclodiphosphate synthase